MTSEFCRANFKGTSEDMAAAKSKCTCPDCQSQFTLGILDLEYLKDLKLPKHTDECRRIMVDGVSLDWKPANNREKWICSEDCPLKESNG